MANVSVNGVSLHYERAGSGPPLLFIHGLGSSTKDWEKQGPAFSSDHTTIAVDLRGHGESDKPPGPYGIEVFASDVAALCDHLGLGHLTVIGISLGGMVAFQLAADRPDLTDRLVVVNALQEFELKTLSQRLQIIIRKLILRFMGMERMGQFLAVRLFPDDDLAEERAAMVERWALNDKTAYQASFQAILDWPGVVDEMSRFERPVLMVASDQDYLPLEAKKPYLEKLPSARLAVIENAHHGVPVERPEEFNTALREFLAN